MAEAQSIAQAPDHRVPDMGQFVEWVKKRSTSRAAYIGTLMRDKPSTSTDIGIISEAATTSNARI